MNDERPERRIKKLAGTKGLSTAIQKLERKKELMEDDLKEQVKNFVENLNPITLLDKTLQNVERSNISNQTLLKEALAFGAGYLSKKKLVYQFKISLIKTLKGFINIRHKDLKQISNNQELMDFNNNPSDNEKENKYMKAQIEKVKAKPEILPEPTYWPFFLALGIVFLGWGLLTTWLISAAGFIILVVALTGWINILRHE